MRSVGGGTELLCSLAQELQAVRALLAPLERRLVLSQHALQLVVLAAGHLRMEVVQQPLLRLQHL